MTFIRVGIAQDIQEACDLSQIRLSKWHISISGGFTSYFGDISYYDLDGWKKITQESGSAFGIGATYHFNNWLGLTAESFVGKITGGNTTANYFATEFLDYNLNAEVDAFKLLIPDLDSKFSMNVFAGAGQLLFRYKQSQFNDGSSISVTSLTMVPEFVYFFGSRFNYHFKNGISITSSLSIHQLQNDKLDNFIKVGDFDYFSFFNLGLAYYFGSVCEKARIKAFPNKVRQ
jgi:hypothetical protein